MTPRLQMGVEYNAVVGEALPRGNAFLRLEDDRRPGINLGVSSDRIGTEEGKMAVFLTFSKQIGQSPVAPYVSLNYSETDRGINLPFGASVALGERWLLIPMYDGRRSHTMLTFSERRYSVTLIAVFNQRFGVSIGTNF